MFNHNALLRTATIDMRTDAFSANVNCPSFITNRNYLRSLNKSESQRSAYEAVISSLMQVDLILSALGVNNRLVSHGSYNVAGALVVIPPVINNQSFIFCRISHHFFIQLFKINCTSAVGDYDTVRCETVTWLLARWAEPITDSQCGEGGQVNSTAVTL